jgi:membrane protein implicated in regulation of membrane protease activity
MIDLDAYRVEPDDTAPPEPVRRDDSPIVLTKEQKRDEIVLPVLGCLGCLASVVFFFIIPFIIVGAAGLMGIKVYDSSMLGAIVLSLSIAAAISLAYFVRRFMLESQKRKLFQEREAAYESSAKKREREYKSEVEGKKKEAQARTIRLRGLLQASITTNEAFPDSLSQATYAIKEAEKEYADSAFDPYWTSVEEAAGSLAAFDRGVRQLSQNARDYYELLKGRRHNFPAFPIQMESLPDPSPVVAEFRRVVRLGQTNFQFANIWEHRKTQKVLFEGFQNLGDAVNNLGGTIMRSFSSLESSISSGLALALDEQVRTRESFAEEAGRTRATIEERADEQKQLAEKQVRLLEDLKD